MCEIDTNRIKIKFYEKLLNEKAIKKKRIRIAAAISIAAVISLTSLTALAANLGVFNKLFNNFTDVAELVSITNTKSKSNGITMQLTSYLADNAGIVPELAFTKNDGTLFANDIMAIGSNTYTPDIKINSIRRNSTSNNIVSDDGKTYYCLPIVHYDIENVGNIPLEVRVNKLIYNIDRNSKTIYYNFFDAYKNADIKTYDGITIDSLKSLFNNVPDNAVQTEEGLTIYSVVFAKVKAAAVELSPDLPTGDGIDLGSLSSQEYDNIVAIKYTRNLVDNGMEYDFEPINILNNNDPFGFGTSVNEDTWYRFFRVHDFDDLNNMGGINFLVTRNNFIKGDWHIKTSFAANQEPFAIDINKEFSTENPDTKLTLVKAEISMFSTDLIYEVKDKEGNILKKINGIEMNNYLSKIVTNEVKLLYSDSKNIELRNNSYSTSGDVAGILNISYEIEMNPENHSLMNTSKLTAIVINGETYQVK